MTELTKSSIKQIKTTVIFLSGKRYAGKSETSKLIKHYYMSQGKNVKITSFSYYLKKKFCEMNSLDFERFIDDHEYKDSFRDKMTKYYKSTGPTMYVDSVIKDIQKSEYDTYIIDDMRLFNEHVKFFDMCSDEWNILYVRVNSTNETKTKRGWKNSEYDNFDIETELDNYEFFDIVLNNDSTIENLNKLFLSAITNVSFRTKQK